ncbi:hypothetical protein ACGFIJ_01230 [Microbispora bryophytorum]|uniref:hypothetical protein n=1 Tax=Microbispora bryophytorum TaxID=1460882 RepID=UPI0037244086
MRGRIDDFLGRSLPEREHVVIAGAERAETWNDLLKTGSLVGRTRPFHLLRWLAFVLFVAGFLLDLLAS